MLRDVGKFGVITMCGNYPWQHEEKIRKILNNETARVMARIPAARTCRVRRERWQ